MLIRRPGTRTYASSHCKALASCRPRLWLSTDIRDLLCCFSHCTIPQQDFPAVVNTYLVFLSSAQYNYRQ
jgi:hypothetical protein